ncbi:hypothetical protein SpiGrapes_0050 [Sphaerochaeta pleomorpha str. Grapes]|uniref:Ig-like domain-containing protein n=1 Tax=Sphaerochaeta pleomorpha (strain ATCC BAA-1885 / DSM 22778 / Grapes) TaxID=158190 RepID=G8QT09_SPHPG|nr:YDG domain-containing protein [Sphaerochaeta pleomorpha]AEV27914.1 hypothetical protein SpiGrapes_0050 [Sphaerochaeta pleomorpha str. Grapes]
MKKTNKKHILLVIVSILLCFVGCSDMMEKLGKISLHIELDNHEVSVASYTLTGTQGSVTLNPEVPESLNVDLSSLKPGTWSLTVKAFDSGSTQIGTGTQEVNLKEGQVLDTTLLVVFTQPDPEVTDFTLLSPSRFDTTDGKIKDTTAKMEYKLASSGDEAYVACTEGETILPPGTYLVRYAAARGFDASEPLAITIPEYEPIQLTIEDPTLTTTKVYDGTIDITGTVTAGALIGVKGTDAVSVSATASYDSTNAENGKTITVTYTLDGADKENYKKPVDKTVAGVIEKKQLTVADPTLTTTKVYDGTVGIAGTVTAGALIGINGTDAVTVSATASYDSTTAENEKTISVGYTLSGGDKDNYFKPVNKTVAGVIEKKLLTVSATATEKVYDGTINATGILSLEGVVGSDEVRATGTYAFADANVGTSKTVNVTGITLSGAKASNYSLSATTATATAAITKATYDMSKISFSGASPTYDGNPHSLSISGTLPSGVSVSYSGNAMTDAGTYTVIASFTGDSSNYEAIASKSATLAIGKATYDMSGISFNGASPTYDGNPQSLSISGSLPFGVSVSYSGNAKTDVGTYTVVASFSGDSANYTAIESKSATLAIGKATYDMSKISFSGASPTYDGNPHSLSISGILPPGVSVSYSGNARTDAGTYTVIASFTGDSSNYEAIASKSATLTISKATMTGTVSVSGTARYGEILTAQPSLSNAGTPTYQWKRSGNVISGATGLTYTLASADIGSAITVVATADGVNYTGSITSATTDTVTKAVLTATVGDFTRSYGEANPSLAVSVTGFVNSESPSTASGYVAPTASAAATASTGLGSYGITLAGGSADNYSFDTSDTGTLTIQQKTLSVTTMVSGKTYDGNTQGSGNFFIGGVVGSDEVGVTGTFTFEDANAGNIKTVNVTGITLTGAQKANYSLASTTATGRVSIYKKTLTVTAAADGKLYDGTINATGSLSLGGIVGSDEVSATGTFAFADVNAGSSKTVNVTGITLSGAKASNYSLSATTATTTAAITKATMTGTVSITGTAKYGETLTAVASLTNAGTPTYQWKRGGVAISGATGTTYILTASDTGYTITVTATAGGSNYQGSITSLATAVVEKNAGESISDSPLGYFPSLPATQTIINFTGFTENLAGIEACVSLNGSPYGSYADVEVDSRGRAMILVGSDVTTATKVQFRKKETNTTYAGPSKEISISEQALSIGDYYQGGVVAYLYTSGFGYVSGEVHGIIAAKNNQGSIRWYNGTNELVGVSNTSVGAGLANTNAIIAKQGAVSTSYAAGLARSYTGGGYADWFLPSLGELTLLYHNSALIGNLNLDGSNYWSSNESIQYGYEPAIYAAGRLFSTTVNPTYDNIYAFWKTDILLVRPIRYF